MLCIRIVVISHYLTLIMPSSKKNQLVGGICGGFVIRRISDKNMG